jgi:hypothetical protein
MKDVIFIVGMPRSGTTLLANILSSHSLICSGIETHLFSKITYQQYRSAFAARDWQEEVTKLVSGLELSNQNILELYQHSSDSFKAELKKNEKSYHGVLNALYSNNLHKCKKPIILEKTPNHLCELGRIRSNFPNAKIIRIVRDPRDSANSMNKLDWSVGDVVRNALLIEKWDRKSRDFFLKDRNSFEIKYEDLVLEFTDTLSELCTFLKIEFEDNLNNYDRFQDKVSTPKEEWKENSNKPINKSLIYQWKKELDTSSAILVEKICYHFILEHNYDTSNDINGFLHLSALDQYPENIVPIIVKNLRTDTIDIVPVLYGSLHTSEFIKCLISSTVLAVMNLIKLRKIKLRFFKI